MNTYADSARAILEKKVLSAPEEHHWHQDLGITYAFLNRKEEAVREGKKAAEILPISKDAVSGSDGVTVLAQIYVLVGEYDAAIDQLEYLLSIPSTLTVPRLKIEPAWAPLREHPRFRKLIERAETERTN